MPRANSGELGQLFLITLGCLVAGSLVWVIPFVLKEYEVESLFRTRRIL